ncbi:hypothetical protein EVJ58_g8412 [Rhodofomes roseus]|uniref:DUF6534 domain-containing protein n=1 Tax=Rhodofomes roseus TaxID=34475 RepID=A0A4Y9Y1C6_9APHY|nr:hypothetical protein EVJ58_g8412 [Rhodofomes roseus]
MRLVPNELILLAYTVVGVEIIHLTKADALLPYTVAGLGVGIACDLLIVVTLIYYLGVRRTGFPKTKRAINLLIVYALNTCMLTTMFAVLHLITFLIYSETMVYTVFWFVLIRLYTCTTLSTLNSRETVKHVLEAHGLISIPIVEAQRVHTEADSELSAQMRSKRAPPSTQLDFDGTYAGGF